MLNDYINRIIARLRQGWTKGAYGRDRQGHWMDNLRDPYCISWCAYGAASAEDPAGILLLQLDSRCLKVNNTTLVYANDHAESVDEVISKLEACKDV